MDACASSSLFYLDIHAYWHKYVCMVLCSVLSCNGRIYLIFALHATTCIVFGFTFMYIHTPILALLICASIQTKQQLVLIWHAWVPYWPGWPVATMEDICLLGVNLTNVWSAAKIKHADTLMNSASFIIYSSDWIGLDWTWRCMYRPNPIATINVSLEHQILGIIIMHLPTAPVAFSFQIKRIAN